VSSRFTENAALGPKVVAVLAGAILSILWSGIVTADNWGAGNTNENWRCINRGSTSPKEWNSECTTEDKNWYVYVTTTVDAWFRDALEDSIYEDYVPVSDFNAYWQVGYNGNTDVFVQTATISNQDPYGFYTTCGTYAQEGGGTGFYRYCDNQEILFDYNHGFTTTIHNNGWKDWAACHELGHTTGLSHLKSDNPARVTCMDYGHDTDDLHPHDVEHLNDCYPRPTSNPGPLTTPCAVYLQ
jgi:hypothetical protein